MRLGLVIFESDLRRVTDAAQITERLRASAFNSVASEATISGDRSPTHELDVYLQDTSLQLGKFLFPFTETGNTPEYPPLDVDEQDRFAICYVQSSNDLLALRRFKASHSRDLEIRVCGPTSTIFQVASELGLVPMPLVDLCGQGSEAFAGWPKNSQPMGIYLGTDTGDPEVFIATAQDVGFGEVWFWSWQNAVAGHYLDRLLQFSSTVPKVLPAKSIFGTVIHEVAMRKYRSRLAKVTDLLSPGDRVEIERIYPQEETGDVYAQLTNGLYVVLTAGHQQYIERDTP